MGKAKRRRLRRQKRKPTPPRCARQPLPREGARVDTPSFQRKGGECRLTDFPRRRLTIRECRFPHIVISSESEKSFSFAVRRCMRVNGNGKRKRSLGCARDDETRKRLFPFLFNLLRKPTPPCCAQQPLPRKGASVDTPSFLWKEVPRRGGGWMGETV